MPQDTTPPDPTSAPTPPEWSEALLLLPWYVNGTLTADEVALVERALRDMPALVDELRRVITVNRWLHATEEGSQGPDRARS